MMGPGSNKIPGWEKIFALVEVFSKYTCMAKDLLLI